MNKIITALSLGIALVLYSQPATATKACETLLGLENSIETQLDRGSVMTPKELKGLGALSVIVLTIPGGVPIHLISVFAYEKALKANEALEEYKYVGSLKDETCTHENFALYRKRN